MSGHTCAANFHFPEQLSRNRTAPSAWFPRSALTTPVKPRCAAANGRYPPFRLFTPSWRKIIGAWNARRSCPNSQPSRYPMQITIPLMFDAKADLRSCDDTVRNPATISISFARYSSKTRSPLHVLPLTRRPHTVLRWPSLPPWHSAISPGSDLSG